MLALGTRDGLAPKCVSGNSIFLPVLLLRSFITSDSLSDLAAVVRFPYCCGPPGKFPVPDGLVQPCWKPIVARVWGTCNPCIN